ncbi:uncharacterized protein MONOS_9234 [Monocercomonoides exilis]|uniref:uncharacterized protein n=1 Tax=Monocercomonoides exilis TaxID=2049356 RepID=UPI00355A8BDC|nr:hypothetical protein MONOS_9234 [Monocercomonoides exilis]|eukprot:MONOS_9234.1-p1 / transcript=MONOS_9234.1 / gene=MONOS_9234 / organism=Monocercomonoides_exilis_PA203 / gene_product=unspecified product / transcript_product=unspecified product / location=Mono_scaffold00373:46601-47287(-) / protein_length=229 / sequence_SO=supercontig / SO=protein_coding / is_pseudo=false
MCQFQSTFILTQHAVHSRSLSTSALLPSPSLVSPFTLLFHPAASASSSPKGIFSFSHFHSTIPIENGADSFAASLFLFIRCSDCLHPQRPMEEEVILRTSCSSQKYWRKIQSAVEVKEKKEASESSDEQSEEKGMITNHMQREFIRFGESDSSKEGEGCLPHPQRHEEPHLPHGTWSGWLYALHLFVLSIITELMKRRMCYLFIENRQIGFNLFMNGLHSNRRTAEES